MEILDNVNIYPRFRFPEIPDNTIIENVYRKSQFGIYFGTCLWINIFSPIELARIGLLNISSRYKASVRFLLK